MRTQEEILERIKRTENEFLSFEPDTLVQYLTFENAKPFLKEGTSEKEWDEERRSTLDNVLEDMKDYMEFAWDKALNHRGLSANRSVSRFTAWLWLWGDETLLERFLEAPYSQYGVPKLMLICEAFQFPVPDEEAANNMAQGKKCCPECEEGCGE